VLDILRILGSILSIALVPALGFGVIRLGQRRAGLTAALLGVVLLLGIAAVVLAARDGFAYAPGAGRVVFGSEAARGWFSLGLVLLTLNLPAWPLLAIARAQNGETTGPVGVQWVFVLFGYWMASLIAAMAIYSWLTGHIK
jgi:hypothetical protein